MTIKYLKKSPKTSSTDDSKTTEIVKELLSIGESLAGSLIIYDGLSSEFRKITIKADPGCPLCGANPEIMDLSSHVK